MPKINKKLTVVTSEVFWIQGAGCWTRLQSIISHLKLYITLDVLYLDALTSDNFSRQQLDDDLIVTSLPVRHYESQNDVLAQLNDITSQSPADIYLIDKAENSYVIDALPADSIKILLADDLVHKRNNSMKQFGITDRFILSARQERALFNRYNAVICIQKNEHATVQQWAGNYTRLFIAHPVTPNPQPLSDKITRIGITGSSWHANINGLEYFIKTVWPEFCDDLTLHIYGYLADAFRHTKQPGIHFHGFQKNIADCYNDIDIAINPVFYGAGLKIKTVEAMGYGLPLITTSEGASGMLELSGYALLVADNDKQFIQQIKTLINDPTLKQQLSSNALAYVNKHLNKEQCYKPLIDYLQCC